LLYNNRFNLETLDNVQFRLLIYEPNQLLQTVLEFRLRRFGLTLLRATNAREALLHIHKDEADIVVLNMHLPDMKPRTFLELVREDLKSNVPILIMADLDNESLIADALDAGADDFISYPFRPNELIFRAQRLLEKRWSLKN
jgi:DNA-binding response OmpR family regulator